MRLRKIPGCLQHIMPEALAKQACCQSSRLKADRAMRKRQTRLHHNERSGRCVKGRSINPVLQAIAGDRRQDFWICVLIGTACSDI